MTIPELSQLPARFEQLTGNQTEPFGEMTYPAYAPLLATLASDGDVVAVAAFARSDSTPLGLGLAQNTGTRGQVLSIFVVESARHQWLGTTLLDQVERLLTQRGCPDAFLNYPRERPSSPFVERILKRLNWSDPQPHIRIYYGAQRAYATVITAPWFRPAELPPGYTLFPWLEATPEECAEVRQWLDSGLAPAIISPFNEEDAIDGDLSIGLRYQGRLQAWLVCHRIGPLTTRYSTLFARPDIPHKGLTLRVLAESLRRKDERDRPLGEYDGCFACVEGTPLIAFGERWFKPYMAGLTCTQTMESHKTLSPA
jgi:GNAT superfamily N-acetyltransferase